MELKQYTQADNKDQRVILRADLDVGVNEQGAVDEFDRLRLERLVPAINELLEWGVRQLVIIGHRGRPAFVEASAGKPEGKLLDEFSLKPVRDNLARLLAAAGVSEQIVLVPDVASDPAGLTSHRLLMLENLRCWPGEKSGDKNFVQQLARWGDVYVNDAFSNSHRSDASMLALPQAMTKIFAGPGLFNEIKHLNEFVENPEHPYVVVLGGAKIETKLPLIKNLLDKSDAILLGGGLANTFFKARGWEIGHSLVDEPFVDEARSLASDKLLLPIDVVITDSAGAARTVPARAVPAAGFIGDIGPETVRQYQEKIAGAQMILYNGPMGKFEQPAYQAGTRATIAAITASRARTLTGGGDTIAVIERLGQRANFDFVSVGGGAMLTFLAGESMPALEVLKI